MSIASVRAAMPTMSTTASEKISIDNAVESACKMFLSTRRLFGLVSESISNGEMNRTHVVDELHRQFDFIKTIADATTNTIRDLRAARGGTLVSDVENRLYGELSDVCVSICLLMYCLLDELTARVEKRLARASATSLNMVDERRESFSGRSIDLDIEADTYIALSKGLKRRQTIGWIPNGDRAKRVRKEGVTAQDKEQALYDGNDVETRVADETSNEDDVERSVAIKTGTENSLSSETLNGDSINEVRIRMS